MQRSNSAIIFHRMPTLNWNILPCFFFSLLILRSWIYIKSHWGGRLPQAPLALQKHTLPVFLACAISHWWPPKSFEWQWFSNSFQVGLSTHSDSVGALHFPTGLPRLLSPLAHTQHNPFLRNPQSHDSVIKISLW